MKIYLIRHGATATNGKTYAGRADVPLNAQGKEAARRIADRLSNRPIALIATSPLSRAVDTIAPLALALGIAPRVDPLLLEFDFGDFEGRSKRDLQLKLRRSHAVTPVPGGESLLDVWNRAGRWLDELARHRLPAGTEVAVIGHFWINRMIFGRITGLDFNSACRSRAFRPPTGSVILLEHQPAGVAVQDPELILPH